MSEKRDYRALSKADYVDKTTAGFIGHVVGVLTGYEFVTLPGTDRGMVGMPDDWFDICAGPYAGPNPHKRHTNKLIKNEATGLWESWVDDDYGVDVFNQFMLRDMYKDKGTVCEKYITDGWLKCDIYDMGAATAMRVLMRMPKSTVICRSLPVTRSLATSTAIVPSRISAPTP